MKHLRNMRLHMISLGCAKNRVDSEKTLAILKKQGCTITEDPETADCILINTCGFINDARAESVNTILELAEFKKRNPAAKLAVMGCMVERFGKEMAEEMPEIDYLLALSDDAAATIYKPETIERELEPGIASAYLKIAEGCGNSCSFCSIPLIRGPLKSRPIGSIVAEARELLRLGVREIVLVAQDTTRYGLDLRMKDGLPRLMRELVAVDPPWLRLMYLYPTLITDEMINLIAHQPNICKYFDIPFQHISDTVLKRMGRHETRKEIESLLEKIRTAAPDASLRSSFIVGFPGETDADFEQLEGFLRSARLNHVGVFTYSAEEGTTAAAFADDVPETVKQERKARLMEIQSDISLEKNREQVGKTFEVLVERFDRDANLLIGRTRGQAPEVDGEVILSRCASNPGEIVPIRIIEALDYDLVGEPA